MTRSTRKTSTTALAVAIGAAMFAAPIAYSASKQPSKVQKGARNAPDFSKLAAPTAHDSFIVSFNKGSAKPSASALRQKLDAAGRVLGVKIAAKRVMGTGAQVIAVSRALNKVEAKRLANELLKDRSVRAVEPNGRMYRMGETTPNDPMYPQQWHYQAGGINVNAAWAAGYTGEGVTVAILDTGSTPHADLQGQWEGGYDFITSAEISRDAEGRDSNPNDEGDYDDKYDSSWHGTHVAGTVGALTNNNLGVAGVADGVKIQPVRVLGTGGGTFEDIADAIVWASGGTITGVPANPNPADIINMSLGGGGACNVLMQDAIDIATDNGTIVVVSAGNSSSDAAAFQPASCEGVITVAGTGPDNTDYASTNYGETIEVAAPGGSGVVPNEDQVLSTLNAGTTVQTTDTYAWYAGTSMASPHVSGTIALMMQAAEDAGEPAITRDRAVTILQNTGYASNQEVEGCSTSSRWCSYLIDASDAVAVAAGDLDLPPTPPGIPEPEPPVELDNGETVALGSMADEEEKFFVIDVPAGTPELTFELTPGTGATGDSDLYVRFAERPTAALYDCRPYTGGVVAEICTFPSTTPVRPAPQAGRYWVRVHAYTPSTNWSLTATYEGGGGGDAPADLEATRVFAIKAKKIRVPLEWTGGDDEVDIVFNDVVAATVDNTGKYTHTFTATAMGAGTATYKVCNAGSTTECSEEIEVSYTARR